MVRTARRARSEEGGGEAAIVTARTASATASSARVASKKMLSAMAMTRRVIGGRELGWAGGVLGLGFVVGLVVVGGG